MSKNMSANNKEARIAKSKQKVERTDIQQPVVIANRPVPTTAPLGGSISSESGVLSRQPSDLLSRQPSSILSHQPSALLQRSVSEKAETTSEAYPKIQTKGRNFAHLVGHTNSQPRIQPKPMAGLVSESHREATGPIARQVANPRPNLMSQAQQSPLIQMKAYTVSRNLPLEPHFKESAENETANLEKDLLGKVRQKFPLSTENERLAETEKWSAAERDKHRPKGFEEEKAKILSQLQPYKDDQGKSTSVWTRGAHVAGLSVASERTRASTPESTVTKAVTGLKDWIGAHLVKREWGGEDNMWNVVSWPKAAEDAWGEGFEEPIDIAFAVGGQRKLDIEIQVTKEDEAVPKGELNDMILEAAPKGFKGDASEIPTSTKSMAIEIWHRTNRGLESIPTLATGASDLGRATLGKGETKWAEAQAGAKEKLIKSLVAAWKVNAQNPHAKTPDPKGVRATEKRVNERTEGLEQERANYRPERYDLAHDIPEP